MSGASNIGGGTLFTPGPWEAVEDEGDFYVAVSQGAPIIIADLEPTIPQRTTEANARLIAAAPGLYDMLAVAVRTIETFNETLKEYCGERSEQAADVVLCANAILAKARGEQ
jgi:hypothetical protein